jgi:hypothetical protein
LAIRVVRAELLERVGAQVLQQLVPHRSVSGRFGRDHRLVDEVCEGIDDVERLDAVAARNGVCCFGVEAPDEHAEPGEADLGASS